MHKGLPHFAQFVLGLLRCNPMNVTDQKEILSGLVNVDETHQTSRVGYISPDLAISLDKLLHADLLYFHLQLGHTSVCSLGK